MATVNGGSLRLQTISENTLLSTFNNGRGIRNGSFLITDSTGQSGAVNFTLSQPKTVGDILNLINSQSLGVEARINDTGDGILLTDTAGGTASLTVRDVGNGKAATDLHLVGSGSNTIDGRTTFQVTLDADDSLQDLVTKINGLRADVHASVFNDGSGSKPLHLSLSSRVSGKAGELLIDTTGFSLSFEEVSTARDALVLVGGNVDSGGVLVSSTSNRFESVIDGVTLTVNSTSTTAITVSVDQTTDPVESSLGQFVDFYNKLRDKISSQTSFNPDTKETGVLFGSNETLRVDTELSRFISSRFSGAGPIKSLESLGVTLADTGKLSFDRDKFREAFAEDPAGVKEFFSKEEKGFADKLSTLIDTLAGANNSLLVRRSETLSRRVDLNVSRIDFISLRLDRQRDILLKQFYSVEQIVGKLQSTQSALANIANTASLISSSKK